MDDDLRCTQSPLYWDWNATTPPHRSVIEAVAQAAEESWANTSSQHQLGRQARARVETVREQLADCFGARPRDVVFAGSGTEANNLALQDAETVVVSRSDHPSLVRVAEAREASGRAVVWAKILPSGLLCLEELEGQLSALSPAARSSTLICVTVANHETGVLQPVEAVAALARDLGCRVHFDAAQSFGKVEPWLADGPTSYTVVGHKIRGPKGIAALVWKGRSGPKPVLLGGSQERGLRPGTVCTPLVVGFGVAIDQAGSSGYERLGALRNRLEAQLAPFGVVHGARAPRVHHVSNMGFDGWTGERMVAALDVLGICVSTGSACSVGTAEPSSAVREMLGEDAARAAVRISFGETTTEQELQHGASVLVNLLKRSLRRRVGDLG